MTILVDDGTGEEVFEEVRRLESLGWSVTTVRETSVGLVVVFAKDNE